MEEVNKEVHGYMKKWGETKATMMKMEEKTEEKFERDRTSWKEDTRVQIGFKDKEEGVWGWCKIRRRR